MKRKVSGGESIEKLRSELPSTDFRVRGFAWLWRNAERLYVHVRHHNHCGRCARVLTVPESIDLGLGPVCASAPHRAQRAA